MVDERNAGMQRDTIDALANEQRTFIPSHEFKRDALVTDSALLRAIASTSTCR